MRTIKFRGKDIETGEWVYGNLFSSKRAGDDYVIIFVENGIYEVDENMPYNVGFAFYEDEVFIVNSASVGQFTGLTDKNGKDIYEGDILRSDEYPYHCDSVDNYYIVIEEVDNDGFLTIAPFSRLSANSTCHGLSDGFERDWDDVKNAEVIGNIHDNVELLKDYEI